VEKSDKIAPMNSPIKAIIFDFGGVLLEWDPRNLYQHYFPNQPGAMEDFLTEIDFFAWNAHQDKGRTFAEGNAELIAQFPQHAKLIEAYFENWEDSITGANEGTVDILHTFKEKGYPVYGLSNWSAETYPRAQHMYPFFDWFDDIILSGEVKLNKPDPAIFNLLLNKIGYTAPECLLIDDSQPNIATAIELGFATVHFTSAEQLQTELQGMNLL
jgi:2-haloacid dehalogenase